MGKIDHTPDYAEAIDVLEMQLHWFAYLSQSGILNCIMFDAFWFS